MLGSNRDLDRIAQRLYQQHECDRRQTGGDRLATALADAATPMSLAGRSTPTPSCQTGVVRLTRAQLEGSSLA